jgi:hypothetical protein
VCSKGECVTGEGGRRQNKRFAENTGNFLIFKKKCGERFDYYICNLLAHDEVFSVWVRV